MYRVLNLKNDLEILWASKSHFSKFFSKNPEMYPPYCALECCVDSRKKFLIGREKDAGLVKKIYAFAARSWFPMGRFYALTR